MRIREIVFNNVRSFRGEHRISFVDPDTYQVRPVTVLAGSNGSGKTTVFEAIESLLGYIYSPIASNEFIGEVMKSGLIYMALELTHDDVGEKLSEDVLYVAVGQRNLLPKNYETLWPLRVLFLKERTSSSLIDEDDTGIALTLRMHHDALRQIGSSLPGGWLFFPHDRRVGKTRGGPIEPLKEPEQWLFHYSPPDQWLGSLEQLWVWQNYLDLEKRDKHNGERSGLPRFTESVEDALGENRRIFIEEGRVRVTTPYTVNDQENSVSPDQLPSGEQQVLLLFGELARRLRQGCMLAIDEIENSLHPTLQRLVMWNLTRLARERNAQVIVSTHSLEIINTVRGSAFVNLDYPTDRFNLPMPDADAN